MLRIGVDVGGTFTDVTIVDEETGDIFSEKVLTTEDPSVGVLDAIKQAKIELPDVRTFVHGTTVAINALIEARGPKTGLLTTKGFEDILEIGRANRTAFFDIFHKKPQPLVPRRWRVGVTERTDARGHQIEPLDLDEVKRAVEYLVAAGVESVAICFLNSYANPGNEILVADLIRKQWPRLEVSASSEVLPEIREYERTSTTVICAYLKPVVWTYLENLEAALADKGCRSGLYVMQSNGGVMMSQLAREKPVHMIESGPVGGAVAAQYIGNLIQAPNVIALDMGGTTCKANIIQEGALLSTTEYWPAGYVLKIPVVDIVEVGIGGGSIGWIDNEGFLTVGPISAGADPGPACYELGGLEPTVTDANVMLGRIENLLGGRMRLSKERATQSIVDRVARPLNLEPIAAARGILEIAISKIAETVRTVTLARGSDPRDYILCAFGGAGPMHAALVAAQMGIRKVLIPPAPGTFSGLGFLCSDFRHDFVQTYLTDVSKVNLEEMEEGFERLEEIGIETLKREGFHRSDISILRSLDIRYIGQAHEVAVPLGPNEAPATTIPELIESFHQKHEATYGHAAWGEPIEIVNLRVSTVGKVEKPQVRYISTQGLPTERGRRKIFFSEVRWVDCPVYDRSTLTEGYRLRGPAIVEELTSTTIVPPSWVCSTDGFTNMILETE